MASDLQDAYWPRDGLEEYGVVSVELVATRELDKGITVREMEVEWAEVSLKLEVRGQRSEGMLLSSWSLVHSS